jgi:hypothetical protein
MILGQNVAEKDAAHGPSEYAREYDQADRGGVHGLGLCSKLGMSDRTGSVAHGNL